MAESGAKSEDSAAGATPAALNFISLPWRYLQIEADGKEGIPGYMRARSAVK